MHTSRIPNLGVSKRGSVRVVLIRSFWHPRRPTPRDPIHKNFIPHEESLRRELSDEGGFVALGAERKRVEEFVSMFGRAFSVYVI